MTDKQLTGGTIALGILFLWLACAIRDCQEDECRAKGGELHGLRDRICVKPGSVIK